MKQVFSLDEYKWHVDHEMRTLTLTKREETAKQWVKRIYKACCNDSSRSGAAVAGKYTVITDDKGNIAKAKCHPDDKYDMATGVAIAYARLRNIPIHPDFVPKSTTKRPHILYEVGAIVYDTRTGRLGIVKQSNGKTGRCCLVQFGNELPLSFTPIEYLRSYHD